MKEIRFKNPDTVIVYGGRTLNTNNLTPELHKELLSVGMAEDSFVEIEAEPAKETPKRGKSAAE